MTSRERAYEGFITDVQANKGTVRVGDIHHEFTAQHLPLANRDGTEAFDLRDKFKQGDRVGVTLNNDELSEVRLAQKISNRAAAKKVSYALEQQRNLEQWTGNMPRPPCWLMNRNCRTPPALGPPAYMNPCSNMILPQQCCCARFAMMVRQPPPFAPPCYWPSTSLPPPYHMSDMSSMLPPQLGRHSSCPHPARLPEDPRTFTADPYGSRCWTTLS